MAKETLAEGNVGPSGQAAAPPLPPGVKLLRTLEGHQDMVVSLAFDPQGGTLASGSRDQTVKFWEVGSGVLLRTLQGHLGSVYGVAFDPKGGSLANGSTDHTVKLWTAQSGKLLRTLSGHLLPILSAAFGPQGTGLRALLPSRCRPARADAVPRAVRELPGPAEPDGDALRAGALQ